MCCQGLGPHQGDVSEDRHDAGGIAFALQQNAYLWHLKIIKKPFDNKDLLL
jgi:hypothetical protein